MKRSPKPRHGAAVLLRRASPVANSPSVVLVGLSEVQKSTIGGVRESSPT